MGRRTLLAILALITPIAIAQSQQVGRISGRVMAAEGLYLPSIQVTVVGTTRGAVSDSAGRFTITAVGHHERSEGSALHAVRESRSLGRSAPS